MQMGRWAAAVAVSTVALGQTGVRIEGQGGGGMLGIHGTARVEPSSAGPWSQDFTAGWRGGVNQAVYLYQRFLVDDEHRLFLGYDLTLAPQPQAGAFLASFYELGVGVTELPMLGSQRRAELGHWKKLALKQYPPPRIVQTKRAPDPGLILRGPSRRLCCP